MTKIFDLYYPARPFGDPESTGALSSGIACVVLRSVLKENGVGAVRAAVLRLLHSGSHRATDSGHAHGSCFLLVLCIIRATWMQGWERWQWVTSVRSQGSIRQESRKSWGQQTANQWQTGVLCQSEGMSLVGNRGTGHPGGFCRGTLRVFIR